MSLKPIQREALHKILNNLPNAAEKILKAIEEDTLISNMYWDGRCGCLIGTVLKNHRKSVNFSRNNITSSIESWMLINKEERNKILRQEICCWRNQTK